MRAYLEQQEWLKNSFITKAFPSMVESSQKLGNLECTGKLVGKWLCSKPITGTSASFSSSSRQLIWSWSSLQLFLPESLLCTLAFLRYFACPGKMAHSESDDIQRLSEYILSCLPGCLKSFPAGWTSEETLTQ